MAGSGLNGNAINPGDQITILGTVIGVSGTGANATVTVQALTGETFTCPAKDCYAPQGQGAAIGRGGKPFTVGSSVTVPADVTSVVGTGKTATVTASTETSQTTVTHTAGTAHVAKKN